MADIFISYAREDREWVEKLATALTGEGYTVWWDWDLLVGKRYRETIETELQTCKATIVVWSQHSVRSDFVRDEAEEGQARNILVPLLKENVRPPAGFRQLQVADLTAWNGAPDNIEFRRMLRGLSHVIGGDPAAEKYDEPAPAAAAPTVAPAPAVEAAVTPAAAPTPVVPPSPQPVVTPQPVVQAEAPPRPVTPEPMAKAPPPPPPKPMGTPPGAIPSTLPSPLANMKMPPASHPVWRYVAIGGVAFIALVYVVMQFAPEPEPPKPLPQPKPVVHTTPPGNNGATGEVSNEARHGRHGSATPHANPANTNPALGTAPTIMGGASADIAPVLQKAETADRDARVQAALGLAAQKTAQSGSTSSDGLPLGTTTLTDGAYAGQLDSGVAQGVGALSYKNGDLYAGQFVDGKVSGRGVVTFANKTNAYGYSGQWAAGAYNGLGVYYLSNGWRFEGTWKDGQLNGPGAKIDPTGKVAEQGTYENSTLK